MAAPVQTRPRGPSMARRESVARPSFLPYVPKEGDVVDEALAAEINKHRLDIRVRKIQVVDKVTRRAKDPTGAYRIGSGAQPKVYLRLVRGLLMVRVGDNWEGVVDFIQKKLAEGA